MTWVIVIFILLVVVGSLGGQKKEARRIPSGRSSSPPSRRPSSPASIDESLMAKREAQIWRKMQKVVSEHWDEISSMSDSEVRTYTPSSRYDGVQIKVDGRLRLWLASGLGYWEATISQDGQVATPTRTPERPIRKDEAQDSPPEFLSQPAWLRGNNTFSLDLVGESRHQKEIAALCGGKTRAGEDRIVWAVINLESAARPNPAGIAVQIAGQTVGYISRSDAKEFCQRLKHEEL